MHEFQSIYNAGPAGKTLGDGPPPSSGCWTAWVDDAVPAGAPTYANNENWTWITGNPSPFHGTACHPSANVAGFHQHYFYNAPQTLPVNAGDTLFCYVYLDPANPPGEVMLQWQAADYTGWSHRAYWGADAITDSWATPRTYLGALPRTGGWVELAVPAEVVDLAGRTVYGMAYSLANGRATWDYAGVPVGVLRRYGRLQPAGRVGAEVLRTNRGQPERRLR